MSHIPDYYAALGVPPDATDDDIRKAYRAMARRLHPDINDGTGARNQFRDITAAYELLSDVVERRRYDLKRSERLSKAYFTLRVTPSKRILTAMSELQILYLLIELIPDRSIDRRRATIPLNLALIADRSVSMNGNRMTQLKVAAQQIIDQLSPQDILSMVSFSDRADIMIKAAPLTDKNAAKAMVSIMQANGGTEIYQGLQAGYDEVQRYAGKNYANHMILITDGRTYGDEQQCLELARRAATAGIGISTMGIGDEWNDAFLDQIASITGGNSEYVRSPEAVVKFLNEKVRSLGQSLAERATVSLAPDPDIKIESIFRLTPNPQPMPVGIDPLQIGQLPGQNNTALLVQIQMPPLPLAGFRSLLRIEATGDIVWDQNAHYSLVADTSIEVALVPPQEEPPITILDALGKLTLYKMQQKASEAVARGEIREATRRLENLATRLQAAGHEELATAAMSEARRVSSTKQISDEGNKRLKYGTRRLLLDAPSSGAGKEDFRR